MIAHEKQWSFQKINMNEITFKLSKHWSPSLVLISVRRLLERSSSAYKPKGILAKHSSFIMCIFDRRCLAKCPWILKAILQSEHLKGLGSDEDCAGEDDNWNNNFFKCLLKSWRLFFLEQCVSLVRGKRLSLSLKVALSTSIKQYFYTFIQQLIFP